MSCEVCGSDRFVDAHHYDCKEGKLSSETINLCRRCHRTYHDRGIEWFDDDKLDKAIEIENKRREIWNVNLSKLNEERLAEAARLPYFSWLQKPIVSCIPLRREDIERSTYWNKKHGVKSKRELPREMKDERQLGFAMIDELSSVGEVIDDQLAGGIDDRTQ